MRDGRTRWSLSSLASRPFGAIVLADTPHLSHRLQPVDFLPPPEIGEVCDELLAEDEEARKHLRVCVIANGDMIHVVGQAIAVLPSAMARSALLQDARHVEVDVGLDPVTIDIANGMEVAVASNHVVEHGAHAEDSAKRCCLLEGHAVLEDLEALLEYTKAALDVLAHRLRPLGVALAPVVDCQLVARLQTTPAMVATVCEHPYALELHGVAVAVAHEEGVVHKERVLLTVDGLCEGVDLCNGLVVACTNLGSWHSCEDPVLVADAVPAEGGEALLARAHELVLLWALQPGDVHDVHGANAAREARLGVDALSALELCLGAGSVDVLGRDVLLQVRHVLVEGAAPTAIAREVAPLAGALHGAAVDEVVDGRRQLVPEGVRRSAPLGFVVPQILVGERRVRRQLSEHLLEDSARHVELVVELGTCIGPLVQVGVVLEVLGG